MTGMDPDNAHYPVANRVLGKKKLIDGRIFRLLYLLHRRQFRGFGIETEEGRPLGGRGCLNLGVEEEGVSFYSTYLRPQHFVRSR